jgi:hypothetical protein
MTRPNHSLKPVAAPALLVVFVLALSGCSGSHSSSANSAAPEAKQMTFASPDEAVQAMIDSIRSDDLARLRSILGPGSDQLISSGDDVADQQGRQKFLASYDAKHQLNTAQDGSVTLVVGQDEWPMPIPLVNTAGQWRFDAAAGRDEILDRRIGKNELDAIQVCLAIVDAQREYAEQNPLHANVPQYAQKFYSDPGEKDGLYWPTAEGERPSPLGPLVAAASDEGYQTPMHQETPYCGYLYRMLKSQSANAPDGACDYVVDGKMVGGFGVVAYPAQYGVSGVMTFIVNYQGTVYQKDLGNDTEPLASAMTLFDPDSSWKPVDSTQSGVSPNP